MFQTEHLQEKWQMILEHPDLPKISMMPTDEESLQSF